MSLLSSVMAQIIRAVAPPVGGDWTPAEIPTALWLDYSDESTLTLDGSDRITEIHSKGSTVNRAAQATEGSRPLSTTYNGLAAADFSGSKHLVLDTPVTSTGDNQFFICAFTRPSAGINTLPLVSSAVGTVSRPFIWFQDNRIYCEWGINPRGFTAFNTSTGGKIVSSQRTGPVLANFELRLSGGPPIALSSQNTGVTSAGAYNWVGKGVTESTTGLLLEFIYIDYAPDTATRQRIEGYLAWRWGLVASLPVGHPYKLAAPTI